MRWSQRFGWIKIDLRRRLSLSFMRSLFFKISITIVLAEAFALYMIGIYYTGRFSGEIDLRIERQIQLPSLLMSRGLLSYNSVANKGIMEQLVGENLAAALVIGSGNRVFYALDSKKKGKRIEELNDPDLLKSFRKDEENAILKKINFDKQSYLLSITPLLVDGRVLGHLYLKVTTTRLEHEKEVIGYIFAVSSLLCIILTTVTEVFLLHRLISYRVTETVAALKRFEQGDMDAIIEGRISRDELGVLQIGFNAMARQRRRQAELLREHANRLEEKVAERTQNLTKSLKEVEDLKEKQDGDYFLTSLLVKPLNSNDTRNAKIGIEFFLEQKKKFKFRRWREEIGGDLNIACDITLQDRDYAVFMNADAMGKSIQGAGGVLVVGSVLHSILERTKLVAENRRVTPEFWLNMAFVEMDRVLKTFDGSMLVSVAFGLVERDSGIVFYLNAEHPQPVLYRNQTAVFMERGHLYYKLGNSIPKQDVWPSKFQMERGDCIFFGSDGKDDVLLGLDDTHSRLINEDEDMFLGCVLEGEGDPENIFRAVLARGELTDDFSLLKISYRG